MVSIGKVVVLTVSDGEENIFDCIRELLLSKSDYQLMEFDAIPALSFPGLEIDLYHRQVLINGNRVELTDLEFRLLLYLARQPGRVFTYQQIYEAVWGEEYSYEKSNIMSHIRHIREKIEADSKTPRYIENVRGVGYRFKKQ